LKAFLEHFDEIHEGYLNAKELLEDTMLYLGIDHKEKVIPFTVSIDESV